MYVHVVCAQTVKEQNNLLNVKILILLILHIIFTTVMVNLMS